LQFVLAEVAIETIRLSTIHTFRSQILKPQDRVHQPRLQVPAPARKPGGAETGRQVRRKRKE